MQSIPLIQRHLGETSRRDFWWTQPLAVFLGLSFFGAYLTWAAFQGDHYEFGNYLSPLYSPLIFGDAPHAWFGPKPGWWPGAVPFSARKRLIETTGQLTKGTSADAGDQQCQSASSCRTPF